MTRHTKKKQPTTNGTQIDDAPKFGPCGSTITMVGNDALTDDFGRLSLTRHLLYSGWCWSGIAAGVLWKGLPVFESAEEAERWFKHAEAAEARM